jgi:lipopolysaccharide transport system ATP-binding protein
MNSEAQQSLSLGAVSIRGIGKAYRLYDKKWGRAAEWLGAQNQHYLHWVLRDISLRVAPGEAVGIIGENGAGKSTLLKLITGVSRPTAGQIALGGHVSALLELGIGFNNMFTGRQNAIDMLRLTGASDVDMPALVEGIEAFADLGEYFEFPVRTYSSGMQCRLAFATATAVRPDVLIVDEALSVGDVFFQQRCFDRIQTFRESGTTLLFVSHSVAAVYALCDRAVLLRDGAIVADGEPRSVIDLYNAHVVAKTSGQGLTVIGDTQQVEVVAGVTGAEGEADTLASETDGALVTRPAGLTVGSYAEGAVKLTSVVVSQQGQAAAAVVADKPMAVCARFSFTTDVDDPHVGLQVRDARGDVMYRSHTHGLGHTVGTGVAGELLEVCFEFEARLLPGDYTLTMGMGAGGKVGGTLERALLRHQDIASFTVLRSADDDFWDGRVNLQPSVTHRRLAAEDPRE